MNYIQGDIQEAPQGTGYVPGLLMGKSSGREESMGS